MSAPPDTVSAPPRRPPAIWPWLVMPIAALSLFFALRSARDHAAAAAPPVTTPPQPTSSADG